MAIDKKESQEAEREYKGTKYERFSLKPIIFLMIVSACYNLKSSKRPFRKYLLWIYHGIILLIFATHLLRNFLHFRSSLVSYLASTLITCQCFGNCFISWKSFSVKHGRFHQAMDMWHQAVSKMIQQKMPVDFAYFNKRQCIIVAVTLVLLAISITSQILIYFIVIPPADQLVELGYNGSFTEPFEDTTGSRLLLTVPICLEVISLTTPAFYLMVISLMLRTGFKGFNKYLKQIISRENGQCLEKLEYCRQIHFELCQIVSKLDKDLCYLYGNIYFWTLGMGIVVLYVILKFPQTLFEYFIYMFYLCHTLGMLFTMSISAAYVHEEAHAPLETIYYINVKTVCMKKATQLNLFLSKLTGTRVGFTTFGLVIITKEFILTIAGVFLTYFAILYTTL